METNIDYQLAQFKQQLSRYRKPDEDFTHKFLGFGIHKSEVNVEIWFLKNKEFVLVMLTDSGKGTSVTNACEQIITEIYHNYLKRYPVNAIFFCETYDKKERIDWIKPTWHLSRNNKLEVRKVEWGPLGSIIE